MNKFFSYFILVSFLFQQIAFADPSLLAPNPATAPAASYEEKIPEDSSETESLPQTTQEFFSGTTALSETNSETVVMTEETDFSFKTEEEQLYLDPEQFITNGPGGVLKQVTKNDNGKVTQVKTDSHVFDYVYSADGKLSKITQSRIENQQQIVGTNLAAGKFPTVSSFYEAAGYTPDRATDGFFGDTSVGWGGQQYDGSTEWLQVDLGSIQSIGAIKYDTRYHPSVGNAIWQSSFKISGSIDGINWFVLTEKEGLTAPQLFDLQFNPKQTRYLKVHDIISHYPSFAPWWHFAYVNELQAFSTVPTGITQTIAEKEYTYFYQPFSDTISKIRQAKVVGAQKTPEKDYVYDYGNGRLLSVTQSKVFIADGTQNILKDLSPQASSSYNAEYGAANATDGKFGDEGITWAATPADGSTEWLQIDLNGVKTIDHLKYDTRYHSSVGNAIWQSSFKISGSLDGVNWFLLAERNDLTTPQLFDFQFGAKQLRFIRVHDIVSHFPSFAPWWHFAYVNEIQAFQPIGTGSVIEEKRFEYQYTEAGEILKLTTRKPSVETPLKNIAEGIVPTVSTFYPPYQPTFATDGNYGYGAEGRASWVGTNPDGTQDWLQLDLGTVQSLQYMKYDSHYHPYFGNDIWQSSYKISGSVDGVNWFGLYEQNGLSSPVVAGFPIDPSKPVRYIRVHDIVSHYPSYSLDWHYAYVNEIEVFPVDVYLPSAFVNNRNSLSLIVQGTPVALPVVPSFTEGENARTFHLNIAPGVEIDYFARIFLDTIGPFSDFTINRGDGITPSLNITLDLGAYDPGAGLESVRYSTDGGNTWTNWESFTPRRVLTLPPGAGNKQIRYQLRDKAQNTVIYQAAILYQPTVPSQPALTYTTPDDRRLFVRDRLPNGSLGNAYAFVAQGVNWAPHTVGAPASEQHLEFARWYQTDLPLMAEMGVNVVRVRHDFGTGPQAQAILDAFYLHGIKVIMAVDSSQEGIIGDLNNISAVVNAYKNHPAILMWAISNGSTHELTEQAAQLIKSLDATHAVSAISNGTDVNLINAVPNVDIWGIMNHPGDSFRNFFQYWKSISQKPMFIVDFGADSYDHRSNGQNQTMQSANNTELWDETFFNLSADREEGSAVGAFLSSWNDEWWRNGSPEAQTVTNADGGHGQVDGYRDQEWFGLVDIHRQPKQSFYDMQKRFLQTQSAVQLSSTPLIGIIAQPYGEGGVQYKLDEQIAYSAFGVGAVGRGITLAVLDESTGIRMKEVQHYDTWGSSDNFYPMIDYINNLPDGSVIIISIGDEGGFVHSNHQPKDHPAVQQAYQLLESLGSTQIHSVHYNQLWTMVAVKGQGKLFEELGGTYSDGKYLPMQTSFRMPPLPLNPDQGRRTSLTPPAPIEIVSEIPELTNNPTLVVEYKIENVTKKKVFGLREGENRLVLQETDSQGNPSVLDFTVDFQFSNIPAAPSHVSTVPGDARLFVQDRLPNGTLSEAYALVARGINWSPASPDTTKDTLHTEFVKWYERDIPMMAKMGVNVVRVYQNFGLEPEALKILDTFYQYGIKVIMTVNSGKPEPGLVVDLNHIQQIVNYYKNHPAILMWALGNEWDLNHYYEGLQTIEQSIQFTEQAAQLIKSQDTNHPVMTFLADVHNDFAHRLSPEAFPLAIDVPSTVYTSQIVQDLVPSVDVWGFNIYRGSSFQDALKQWKTISDKPMMIGEFGTDSFDHEANVPDETSRIKTNTQLWDELYFDLSAERTNGAVIGALAFSWNDDWWQDETPGVQNPNNHDYDRGFPFDREYFGVVDINRNPKPIYAAWQNKFLLEPTSIAVNPSPIIRASSMNPLPRSRPSHGISSFEIDEKVVYWREGGGYGGRGINVGVIDPNTGILMEVRNFDTNFPGNSGNHIHFDDLIAYLDSLSDGTIIALSIGDDGGFKDSSSNTQWLDPRVEQGLQKLESLGSTQIRNVPYKGRWAMITVKGQGKLDEDFSATENVTVEAQINLTLNPDFGRRTVGD